MHRLKKLAWVVRAVLLSPGFGQLRMPSYLGSPTLIRGSRRIFIDRRVRIFPGLLAETHSRGEIHIHENVAIGENFHVTAMGELHIGKGTVITGSVTVTDIDHEYRDISRSVLEQPFIHRKTEIGDRCFIGMGARIQAGTVLGDGCVVGANSVVRGSFPAHSVIVGIPGRVVKRYDEVSGTWERVE